jgi:hypothetical protein
MNFKPIKTCSKELENKIIIYFLKSKPYEFCEQSSRNLAILKIKEYIDFLFSNCQVFVCEENDKISLFAALTVKEDTAIIDFCFGDEIKMKTYFAEFRKLFKQEHPEILGFYSELTRKHKLKSYLKYIKRHLKGSEINIDNNGKITVYWR